MKKSFARAAVVAAAMAGMVASTSVAASASPAGHHRHSALTAVSYLSGRPDSGAVANWAQDTMTRVFTITQTGYNRYTRIWSYTATVRDTGMFITDWGTYTPNQAGKYSGMMIKGQVNGKMHGWADYSFTASKPVSSSFNLGIAMFQPGLGNQTTSDWYMQAFPAGTVFGGSGIGNWGWYYYGPYCLSITGSAVNLTQETWADTSANGGGDLVADGNITGACSL